ncbi:MAG: TonB C-terminal domain-containing protein [Deltaproteobacteria bacterium]|nr:TonB C-terminal domain-containing protein [Deltaproteobacteria bacterium]
MFQLLKALWNEDKGFGFFFAVSALFHVVIFIFFLFTSSGNHRLSRNLNAIDVNLISISKAGGIKSASVSSPQKKSTKPVEGKKPKSKKEPKKTVKQNEKKTKNKKTTKKSIPKKDAKEKAKKEIKQEKNTEADRAKVASAIDKIKKSMEAEQLPDNPNDNPAISDTKEGEGGFSSMTDVRHGSIIGNIVSAYQAEVAWRIEQNWFFSGQTSGQHNIKAILIIEIMKSGEIKEVYFETKSGSPYLDESAYKAVLKSNPLPPLPDAFGVSSYKLGLTFTPSGIE